ncbi:hypothetical protein ACLK19_16575 [Escherichia coli]
MQITPLLTQLKPWKAPGSSGYRRWWYLLLRRHRQSYRRWRKRGDGRFDAGGY